MRIGPILIRKLPGMGSRDLILPDGRGDAKGGVRREWVQWAGEQWRVIGGRDVCMGRLPSNSGPPLNRRDARRGV